jgi:hypothetical protein
MNECQCNWNTQNFNSGTFLCKNSTTSSECLVTGKWKDTNCTGSQTCEDGKCNSAPPTTCSDYQGNPVSAGYPGCKTATTKAWCNSGVWINDYNCATNGGTCVNGECQTVAECSKVGDACCLGGSTGKFCNSGLKCGSDSKCASSCGIENYPCCYNPNGAGTCINSPGSYLKCDSNKCVKYLGWCYLSDQKVFKEGDTFCQGMALQKCEYSGNQSVVTNCSVSCEYSSATGQSPFVGNCCGGLNQACCTKTTACSSGLSCVSGVCKNQTTNVCGNRPDGTARVVGESWCTGNTLYECINPTGTLINLRTTPCTDGCATLTNTTAKCNVVKKYWQHEAVANGYNCSTDSRWMCTETTTVTKFADRVSCENDVGCDATFYRYTCNPVTGNWNCANTPQSGKPSYSEATYGSVSAAQQACIVDDASDLCKKTQSCSVCAEEKTGYQGPDKKGGDYNCDGSLTTGDYIVWRGEYLDYVIKNISKNRYLANGNCAVNPDLYYLTGTRDYSLWREMYLK